MLNKKKYAQSGLRKKLYSFCKKNSFNQNIIIFIINKFYFLYLMSFKQVNPFLPEDGKKLIGCAHVNDG